MSATLCELAPLGVWQGSTDETPLVDLMATALPLKAQGEDDLPNDGWSLAELTARVIAEGERIDAAEASVTPRYWYQGCALNAARKHFRKGEWGDYLKGCHVTKDQARSARKLAALYKSPKGLENLSVRAALRLAKGERADPTTARLLPNIAARLRGALKATHAAAQAVKTTTERAALAGSIERTAAALSALANHVREGERR